MDKRVYLTALLVFILLLGSTYSMRTRAGFETAACSYNVTQTGFSFGSAGGSGSVSVTSDSVCSWTANSVYSWIGISSGGSGAGNGTVSFTIAANTGAATRSGSLLVAGKFVVVIQSGSGGNCPATLINIPSSPSGLLNDSDCRSIVDATAYADLYAFSGQAGQRIAIGQTSSYFDTYLTLLAPNGSALAFNDDESAGSSDSRIPPGTGYYTLPVTGTYLVEASSYSSDATGYYQLSLTEIGISTCSYSVTPQVVSLTAAAASADITITTAGNCSWAANATSSWTKLNSSYFITGTGSNVLTLSVDANVVMGYRTGKIIIAGQYIPIIQAGTGGNCPLTSLGAPVTVNGSWGAGDCASGSGSFTDLYWFAGQAGQQISISLNTTNNFTSLYLSGPHGIPISWFEGDGNLRIPSGSGGIILPTSGAYLIEAGSGVMGNYSLNLSVPDGCTYSLSAPSQSIPADGGTGSVSVTTQSGCTWSATPSDSWMTITSGAGGTGNGTVNFSVSANPGANPRTGTITIGGQALTVNQAGATVACPSFSLISPASGTAGANVTINGTGFTGVNSIRFTNNVSANYIVVSDTTITTTVPVGAITGPIIIGKTGCSEIKTSTFTVGGGNCITPPTGMVAWWPFDQNTTDIRNGNNGTTSGGPVYSTGKVDQAMLFDGVDDYLTVAASSTLDLGTSAGFTFDAWVKPDFSADRDFPILDYSNIGGSEGVTFSLDYSPSYGGTLYASIHDTTGAEHLIFTPDFTVVTGVFQHLAATYDKSTGMAKLYLNGVEKASSNLGVFTPKTTSTLYLGRFAAGFGTALRFKGMIDELEIFNRALSAGEVQAIFSADSYGKCKSITQCQTESIDVSIPTQLTGNTGGGVTAPIAVTDLTGRGVISYDLVVTYDPAVLRPSTIPYDKSGTLSGSMSVTTNTGVSGELRLSVFGAGGLTGSGILLNLKFDVIGSPSACSNLTFTSFKFNEGNPCSTTTAGRVCVTGGTISGRVIYCISPKGVPEVTMSASGSPSANRVTDGEGNYILTGLGGGAYTVTPSRTGDPNGIASFDAALVSQHVVGLTTLNQCQRLAGDASGDGNLTSFDAAMIAQFTVGVANPLSRVGTWKFTPADRTYPSLSGNQTGQDFSAVLVGDVSGNWAIPSIAPAAIGTADPIFLQTQAIQVSLPTTNAVPGASAVIPVTVGDLSGRGVIAYDFDLVFDQNVLQLQNEPIDISGTLSSAMTVTPNPSPGRLRVSAFAITPLTGTGILIKLKFNVTGSVSTTTTLNWQKFQFNEGNPQANPVNGRLTVVPVATISLSPATQSIPIGGKGALTATLSTALPADISLALNSSNPGVASVPPSLNLPAGQTITTFDVTGVTVGGPVTITAGIQIIGGLFATASVTVIRPVYCLSSATYFGDPLASESIIAAFGTSLATETVIATTIPLPTTLGGTKVEVKDSQGATRLAPLFYVSAGQVNFQIPPGTFNGPATVNLTNSIDQVSTGAINITSVAPGLFSANSNGAGVASAWVLRVKPSGEQIYEAVAVYDEAQMKYIPLPIDFGPAADQLFLILYGTGIRLFSNQSAVTVSIGGTNAPVLYAGPQGVYVGLDQINIQLNRNLAGRGEVDIALTVEEKPANIVKVAFKQ